VGRNYLKKYRVIVIIMSLLRHYIKKTPLEFNSRLSELFGNSIYLKREDLQVTRSFKIRGVMNKILTNFTDSKRKGIICASTGNHAQAVAYCCHNFGIDGVVFIPQGTPKQKINMIKYYGKDNITIVDNNKTFNESLNNAYKYSKKNNKFFIHPFNDHDVIKGQSTIGDEILSEFTPDIVITGLGGGGLLSGVYNTLHRKSKVIGIEPVGARSMTIAINKKKPYNLKYIDRFIDGAAVSKIGELNFNILNKKVEVHTVTNYEVCKEIVDLYNYDGIITEPAGALSVAGLKKIKEKNKKIVCVISGGNNDITRYNEILDFYNSD